MIAIRAVLFDFFGTLTYGVRRGPAHESVADLLGLSVETLIPILDDSFYLRASGQLGDPEQALRWVCRRAGAYPSEVALRAAVALRHRVLRAETRLRSDAVPVLVALRDRGLRTGLISDCTEELPAFLPQLPIHPLLDARVFSIEMGRCKPDLALYLAACRRLGVTPDECLYLGDGGSQELTGAERSGMTALRLATPDLAEHLAFNPDREWHGRSLPSLGDLVALIDGGSLVDSSTLVNSVSLVDSTALADSTG